MYHLWVHFGLEKTCKRNNELQLKKKTALRTWLNQQEPSWKTTIISKNENTIEFSKYYLPTFEAGNTAVFPIVWSSKRNSMNRSHKKTHCLEWKYLSPPPCVHRLYSKQLPWAISLWFWHNLSVKTVIQNKYTSKISFKVKLWKENFPKHLVMDIKNTHLYGLLDHKVCCNDSDRKLKHLTLEKKKKKAWNTCFNSEATFNLTETWRLCFKTCLCTYGKLHAWCSALPRCLKCFTKTTKYIRTKL